MSQLCSGGGGGGREKGVSSAEPTCHRGRKVPIPILYINKQFCVSNDNHLILTLCRTAYFGFFLSASVSFLMYACAGVGILYLVLLLQLIGDVEPVCWVRVRTLRLLDMTRHSQLPRTHSILSYLGYRSFSAIKDKGHSQLPRILSILSYVG